MNAPKTDHDIWMEKIMAAVRSVRLANRLAPVHLRSSPDVSQDVDPGTRSPPVA